MFSWGVHLAHAGRRRVGLLQRLEDGVWGDVGLLAVLRFALAVLDGFPPPGLVFVVGVIFLVLHSQAFSLLHERPLLYLIEQSRDKKKSQKQKSLICGFKKLDEKMVQGGRGCSTIKSLPNQM